VVNMHAQKNLWINIGFGECGLQKHPLIFSRGLSLNFESKNYVYSLRTTTHEEFVMFTDPPESFNDYAVLYGITRGNSKYKFTLSGGLSFVNGVRRGNFIYETGDLLTFSHYQKNHWYTFGIPIESQLFFCPFSFLGFGVTGFANLNPERSFAGFLFGVQIGKIRSHN
jgi:hypothetical protein